MTAATVSTWERQADAGTLDIVYTIS